MSQFDKSKSLDNILKEYYEAIENHLQQNMPHLSVSRFIKINKRSGRKFLINSAFTCGIMLMSGILILTITNQSELARLLENTIENTNIIENIRSGSINMFEILSDSFI